MNFGRLFRRVCILSCFLFCLLFTSNLFAQGDSVMGGGAFAAVQGFFRSLDEPQHNLKALRKGILSKEDFIRIKENARSRRGQIQTDCQSGDLEVLRRTESNAGLDAGFNLSGTVKDPSGNAVSGAWVDLYSSTGKFIKGVQTDSAGRYSITLSSGSYNVYIRPPDGSRYLPQQVNNISLSQDKQINFQLKTGLLLTGTVKDSSGNPVSKVWIDLYSADVKRVNSGRTDDTGYYSIALPSGTYNMRVHPPDGTRYLPQQINNISVSQDKQFNIQLETKFLLTGTVKDSSGNPVSGVWIDLYSTDGRLINSDRTDDAGYYSIALAPSTYNLRVDPPRGTRYVAQQINSVSISQDKGLNFQLESGFLLSGTVRDPSGNPISGVWVDLFSTGGKLVNSDQSDNTGHYSVALPSGTYNLYIDPPEGTKYVSEPVNSISISQDKELNIQLKSGFALSGTVKNPSGSPVSGVWVDAYSADGKLVNSDRTDNTGNYSVILSSGTYNVAVDPPKGSGYLPQQMNGINVSQDKQLNIQLKNGAEGKPNLMPYQPPGWSDKIVVSNAPGTTTDSSSLYPTDTLYVNFAMVNDSDVPINTQFYAALYVDGALKNSWPWNSLGAHSYGNTNDYSIGSLSGGTHTVKIVIDSTGVIGETNEGDNEYSKTITVQGQPSQKPNLVTYQRSGWSDKIVVSNGPGTTTDSTSLYPTDTLYVGFAVLNDSDVPIDTQFYVALYVDGTLKNSWYWNSLGAHFYGYANDYPIGSLDSGTHTVKIVIDSTGVIGETNEGDNEYSKMITVQGQPSQKPNLVPYQPSGWSDKIVVSNAPGTTIDTGSLKTADSLYVSWAVLNDSTVSILNRFYVALYIDNQFKASWYFDSLTGGYYGYVNDYAIGMLGSGTHTVTIVVDSDGQISESDEADNEYDKAITVGVANPTENLPNLVPYQPEDWSDAVVVSTSKGSLLDSSSITWKDNLYLNWAIENSGPVATPKGFSVDLYIDGILQQRWTNSSPLKSNYYRWVRDYGIGKLGGGDHLLELVVDSKDEISESDEDDNYYAKWITVEGPFPYLLFPNLRPYQPEGWPDKLVISSSRKGGTDGDSLTVHDRVHVDWAMINDGLVGTSKGFLVNLYLDGVLKKTWKVPALEANGQYVVRNYSIGKLGAGFHTFTIVVDPDGVVNEEERGDNEYDRTIDVLEAP